MGIIMLLMFLGGLYFIMRILEVFYEYFTKEDSFEHTNGKREIGVNTVNTKINSNIESINRNAKKEIVTKNSKNSSKSIDYLGTFENRKLTKSKEATVTNAKEISDNRKLKKEIVTENFKSLSESIDYLGTLENQKSTKSKEVTVSDAKDISEWFLNKKAMTPKQLQIMTYYAYVYYLVKNNESPDLIEKKLFKDNFEAWVHGPVINELYQKYRKYKYNPIPRSRYKPKFPREVEYVLTLVFDKYKAFDGNELSDIVRNEEPWLRARRGLSKDQESNEVISNKDIHNFYERSMSRSSNNIEVKDKTKNYIFDKNLLPKEAFSRMIYLIYTDQASNVTSEELYAILEGYKIFEIQSEEEIILYLAMLHDSICDYIITVKNAFRLKDNKLLTLEYLNTLYPSTNMLVLKRHILSEKSHLLERYADLYGRIGQDLLLEMVTNCYQFLKVAHLSQHYFDTADSNIIAKVSSKEASFVGEMLMGLSIVNLIDRLKNKKSEIEANANFYIEPDYDYGDSSILEEWGVESWDEYYDAIGDYVNQ